VASVLVCAQPIIGHVGPILGIVRALVADGHDVRVLTGAAYRERVEAMGARFVPLPVAVDWSHPDGAAPVPPRPLRGTAAVRFDLVERFAKALAPQWRALSVELELQGVDAVLTDMLFTGAVPLSLLPRAERPLIIGLHLHPLTIPERGVPPYGLGLQPMRGPFGRIRDAVVRAVSKRVIFDHLDRAMGAELAALLHRDVRIDYRRADLICDEVLAFTVPSFDYDRRMLPSTVHYLGPIRGDFAVEPARPDWWSDLEIGLPIVHVTQGTVANLDFEDLVLPTIEALAHEGVLVVVSTGGRPISALPAGLPANVRVGSFLPYDELLPRVAVVVANGGHGSLHEALAHGVPLVVAGTTEDKLELTARVAWSGAGVDLHTERPSPAAVRQAVRRVLDDPSYRANAQRIATDIAAAPGVSLVVDLVRASVEAESSAGAPTVQTPSVEAPSFETPSAQTPSAQTP
jgi:UDP:flavonoid glycosyltransferase YjiC (YdhE family)